METSSFKIIQKVSNKRIVTDLEGEIWKSIEGYEGLYEISSKGRVVSLSRTIYKKSGKPHPVKEKVLSISKNSVGYYCANLWKDNKGYAQLIHILLAKAFIPNPDKLPYVLHKNDIKDDIRLENLYWGSNSDNVKDSINNGNRGIGENHKLAKLTFIQVEEIKCLLSMGIKGKDIAKQYNVSEMIISDIKNNKTYKNEV